MDLLNRAVVIPAREVVVYRAPWRQVLGNVTPLASCAQNIHHTVHHLAHHHLTLAATMLGGRDQGLDQGPFLVGQVTWVTQPVTVVAGAVFRRPHLAPHAAVPTIESQAIRVAQAPRITDSNDSQTFRTDTQEGRADRH